MAGGELSRRKFIPLWRPLTQADQVKSRSHAVIGIHDGQIVTLFRMQERGKCFPDQGNAVAIAAQVSEADLFPAWTVFFGHPFEYRLIGKVPVASANALFDGPRTLGVLFQKLDVVVGFDHQQIHFADAFADQLWQIAQVGYPGQAAVW